MNDGELNYEPSSKVHRNLRCRGGFRWIDVGVSAFLILAVSVPTMAVEEDWHGSPMIDQPTHLWVIAACLVAAAFLVGGTVAGYRRPAAATMHATAAAVLAVAVLLVGAVSHRIWLAHRGMSIAVALLWCLAVVAAVLLSGAGALFGRRITTATR
jgi:hypothetical protein